MKRFIVSILCVSVFFIGLGALADKAGAKFRSDDKALEIIRQARLAIGGDQAIASVRSMTITGRTSVTVKAGESERTEQGDTEIAIQLPNGFMRMTKIGRTDGLAGEQAISAQHEVMIVRKGDGMAVIGGGGETTTADGQKVIVRKMEGGEAKEGEFTTPDGKKVIIRHSGGENGEPKVFIRKSGEAVSGAAPEGAVVEKRVRTAHEGMRQNELLRTTLALLLTAPEGMDVNYTFAGESDVDGTACNVVNAEFAGSSVKLYISKSSSLPVMIAYQGHAMPQVFSLRTKAPEGEEVKKDNVVFVRSGAEGPATEFQVRFSDFRGVNGVQLPFRWTTSAGGRTIEVLDVTNYDINPANIAEKFQNQKVFLKMKKDEQ